MERVFQRLLDKNFSELSGAVLDATIPVPQTLINEIAAAALVGNKNLSSLAILVHPQNRLSMNVKTSLLPWPLNLKLKLDNSVDLASYSSPKIRAWLENNRLLGSLGSLFNVLPEGVKLYGNQIVIDLGSFLQRPEQKRLLGLVRSVDIRTAESKLILDVKIRVE